jgi:hypothetical protein
MLAMDDQYRVDQLGEIKLRIMKDVKDKPASVYLLTHYQVSVGVESWNFISFRTTKNATLLYH